MSRQLPSVTHLQFLVLEALDHARRTSELERLRSEIQLESARLQADRAAAATSYGGGYYDGYPYDPYYFGGLPYYPGYPVYGYGGGFRDRRFDRDGRFPAHHRRFDDGRFGHPGQPGSVGQRRFEGGLHHTGGQPARPLTPTHNTHTLAPARR